MQVGLQAYLMWEQAGKPDGADFSYDARNQLQQQLASGKSVQDIENALRGPKKTETKQDGASQTGDKQTDGGAQVITPDQSTPFAVML